MKHLQCISIFVPPRNTLNTHIKSFLFLLSSSIHNPNLNIFLHVAKMKTFDHAHKSMLHCFLQYSFL